MNVWVRMQTSVCSAATQVLQSWQLLLFLLERQKSPRKEAATSSDPNACEPNPSGACASLPARAVQNTSRGVCSRRVARANDCDQFEALKRPKDARALLRRTWRQRETDDLHWMEQQRRSVKRHARACVVYSYLAEGARLPRTTQSQSRWEAKERKKSYSCTNSLCCCWWSSCCSFDSPMKWNWTRTRTKRSQSH